MLNDINPERYRLRFNQVAFTCIAYLMIGSLLLSQLLIHIFPSPQGTHFHWNLLGVILTAASLCAILLKLKKHPFFYELSYVWDLKQSLNRIIRRMKKIESAAERGEHNALQILHFSYSGSRQLWLLDNNTLTLNHLTQLENKLAMQADKYAVTLDITSYSDTYLLDY